MPSFASGISSGFGHQLTKQLLEQGHRVDGTLRRPEAVGDLRAIPNGAVAGRCVLAIRPENVALCPAEGGGAMDDNVVRGRVAFVSYLGNTLRYDLETPGGLVLKVDIRDPWHHDPLPIGHAVTAIFSASVTLAVSDDT